MKVQTDGEINLKQNGIKEGELNEKLQSLKRNLKRPITIQLPVPNTTNTEGQQFHTKQNFN